MPLSDEEFAALMGGAPPTASSGPGLVDRALGVLSLPRKPIDYALQQTGLVEEGETTGGALRRGLGLQPTPESGYGSRLAGGAVELAGDIATDPLTWAGFGLVGRAAKASQAMQALTKGEKALEVAKAAPKLYPALQGVRTTEELRALGSGLNRVLPTVQKGSEIGFGATAALGGGRALVDIPRTIREEGGPAAAEQALHAGVGLGAAYLTRRHWKNQRELAKAREAVDTSQAQTAAAAEQATTYETPEGFGTEDPTYTPQNFADFVENPPQEQPPVRPAEWTPPEGYAYTGEPVQTTMFGAAPHPLAVEPTPKPRGASTPESQLSLDLTRGPIEEQFRAIPRKPTSFQDMATEMGIPRTIEDQFGAVPRKPTTMADITAALGPEALVEAPATTPAPAAPKPTRKAPGKAYNILRQLNQAMEAQFGPDWRSTAPPEVLAQYEEATAGLPKPKATQPQNLEAQLKASLKKGKKKKPPAQAGGGLFVTPEVIDLANRLTERGVQGARQLVGKAQDILFRRGPNPLALRQELRGVPEPTVRDIYNTLAKELSTMRYYRTQQELSGEQAGREAFGRVFRQDLPPVRTVDIEAGPMRDVPFEAPPELRHGLTPSETRLLTELSNVLDPRPQKDKLRPLQKDVNVLSGYKKGAKTASLARRVESQVRQLAAKAKVPVRVWLEEHGIAPDALETQNVRTFLRKVFPDQPKKPVEMGFALPQEQAPYTVGPVTLRPETPLGERTVGPKDRKVGGSWPEWVEDQAVDAEKASSFVKESLRKRGELVEGLEAVPEELGDVFTPGFMNTLLQLGRGNKDLVMQKLEWLLEDPSKRIGRNLTQGTILSKMRKMTGKAAQTRAAVEESSPLGPAALNAQMAHRQYTSAKAQEKAYAAAYDEAKAAGKSDAEAIELAKDAKAEAKAAASAANRSLLKVSTEEPISAEGKTTIGETLAEAVPEEQLREEAFFRGSGIDRATLSNVLDTVPLGHNVRQAMDLYYGNRNSLSQVADAMKVTIDEAEGLLAHGTGTLLRSNLYNKLKGVSQDNVDAFMKGMTKRLKEGTVQDIPSIPRNAPDADMARRVLAGTSGGDVLTHIRRLEERGQLTKLKDYARYSLGYRPDHPLFTIKDTNRFANRLLEDLGLRKRGKGGRPAKALGGPFPLDTELLTEGAKKVAGTVGKFARKLSGQIEEPLQAEAVVKEVSRMGPEAQRLPTTPEADAIVAGARQQGPLTETKPQLRPGDRAAGVELGAINTIRMNLGNDPKAQQILQDFAEAFKKEQEVKTWREADAEADAILRNQGMDAPILDVAKQLEKGYAPGDTKMELVRRITEYRTRVVADAHNTYLQAINSNNSQLAQEALTQLTDAAVKFVAVGGTDVKAKTAIARALAILRKNPSDSIDGVVGNFRKALTLDPTISRDGIDAVMGSLKTFMGAGTLTERRIAALAFKDSIQKATQRDVWSMVDEAYKGALIGPAANIANGGGNTMNIGVNTALKQTLTPLIDTMLAKKTGERTVMRVPPHLTWEAMRSAMKSAAPLAWDDVKLTMQAKELDFSQANLRDIMTGDLALNQYVGAIPGRLGEFARTSLKLLGVGDAFFKPIIRSRELMQYAWTKAMKEGAAAPEVRARQIFAEMLDWHKDTMGSFRKLQAQFGDPQAKVMNREIAKAWAKINETVAEEVFQKPGGESFQSFVRASRGPVLRYIDTFVFPFKLTPLNILKTVIDYTPIPGAKRLAQLHFGDLVEQMQKGKIDQAQVAHEIARSAFGTATMAMLYMLAADGNLTGGGPVDPRTASLLKQTGWQPYSLKVGDQYISYQRLEPFSSLFGLASDMAEGSKLGDFNKATTAMQRITGSIAENLTSKTFLSGLEGLFTMFHDPKQYMGRFVRQLSGSLVPNVVGPIPFGALGRAMDPLYRQTEAFTTEPMIAKIPGLSETLIPQASPSGTLRKKPGTFGERLLSPFGRTTAETGPEAKGAQELFDVGYTPTLPIRSLKIAGRGEVKLTKEEQQIMQEAQEEAARKADRISKDPTYNRLPDNEAAAPTGYTGKTKKDVLERVYREQRKRALSRVKLMMFRRLRGQQPSQASP